jgi:hypothetical protein
MSHRLTGIDRCIAEQTYARAYLDSDGPDKAGAWAGLCDWLCEECFLRLEARDENSGRSSGDELPG